LAIQGPRPALHLDFSPVVSFEIKFLDYDAPANTPMIVNRVLVGSAGLSSISGVVAANGAQTLSISTLLANPAALADVDGLGFAFNSPRAADFRLDSIKAVIPEPAMLALRFVAAAALLTRRRK